MHRLLVVSIDAFQPRFYLNPSFGMTYVGGLAKKGLSFKHIKPIFPSVTYPSHTSIVTGVPPSVHGIIANNSFDFKNAVEGDWFFESEKIRAKTIFKSFQENDIKLALLHWPVSRSAIADYVIPEILLPPTFSITAAWEPTISESLPKRWLSAWMQSADKKIPATIEEEDALLADVGYELLTHTDVQVVFIHFSQVDLLQHREGPHSKAIPAALQTIDHMIEKLASTLDLKKDTIVVLGDHGFSPTKKTIHLNALLKENGLYPKASAHSTGGAAAIYLQDPNLAEPVTNFLKRETKRGFRFYSKKDLDRLQGFPSAFAALEALPGVELSSKKLDSKIEESMTTEKGTHGATSRVPGMETGLIIAGRGIDSEIKPEVRDEASLLDIAPTLTSILGITWPTGPSLLAPVSGNADTPSRPALQSPAAK